MNIIELKRKARGHYLRCGGSSDSEGGGDSSGMSADTQAALGSYQSAVQGALDASNATPDTPAGPSMSQNEHDAQQAAALGMSLNAYRDVAYGPGEAPALDAGTSVEAGVTAGGSWGFDGNGKFSGNIQDAARDTGLPASYFNNMNNPTGLAALGKISPTAAGIMKGINALQDKGLPGYVGETYQQQSAREAAGGAFGVGGGGSAGGGGNPTPFGSGSTSATTTTPAAAAGQAQYVWDGTKYVKNDGTNQQSRSDMRGMFTAAHDAAQPQATFASGGDVGIAAGAPTQARYVDGPGDGQSDSVAVQMDDGGEGRLADGEFVVDATTVAGLGNGSSKAGAKALYDMVARVRTQAHGKNKLQNPVNPAAVMPA